MQLRAQAMIRTAVVCIAAWTACCARPTDPTVDASPVLVELLTVKPGLYEPTATYRVVNNSDHALAYRGSAADKAPVLRLAIQSNGKWVEREPAWAGCGTGLEYLTLEPGAEISLELKSPRPDLPMRVGIGTWDPVDGAPPMWKEWTWTWSAAKVLADDGDVAAE